MSKFKPRAAMFTLYGDYVRHKGGEIGIGSLIKLLVNFGLSEQAIRSAVSRMCRGGLLKVRRDGLKSYYKLTEKGFSLLSVGANRIFRRTDGKWDGNWAIVVYFIPERERQARDRLRLELGWMGYGPLGVSTWISPRDLTAEAEELIEKLGVSEYVRVFRGKEVGDTDPRKTVARCWDLDRLHQKYASFIAEFRPKLEDHLKRIQAGEDIEPRLCFVERFKLIHEYRRLPYFDPDLPEELLSEGWLRSQAAALFQEYHGLLEEKANQYFDSVLMEY